MSDSVSLVQRILDEVEGRVIDSGETARIVLATILARGHVLLEDVPGLGKTLMARSFAELLGLTFHRVQFTPDLLPSDLTGATVFDQRSGEFVFHEGPVFTGLLLADEINRTPPKTQAALLEAMQERQVTTLGVVRALPDPFVVLATANPVENEGTFPLPEAQLDRFMVRVRLGYPGHESEGRIVDQHLAGIDSTPLDALTDAEGLLGLQGRARAVHVSDDVRDYAVRLVRATREHQSVQLGASPRASIALVTVAQGLALTSDRDHATPDDVRSAAPAVLAHRIVMRPELWASGATAAKVVDEVIGSVPTPEGLTT
ncbi:AAA family ATPase [Actinomycetota bacterium]